MKISTILDHIDSGHMALPEFQRGYVWNRDQVRGLMSSLYQRHPVGSLLVWATESESAQHRGDATLAPGVVKLLLDGQQRMSSLYGIIRGHPPKFFDGNAKSFTGLRFHLGTEEFAFYQPIRMSDDPLWIDVSELMQRGTSGLGEITASLGGSPEHASKLGNFIGRLSNVLSIADIDLHVEEVTGQDKTIDVVVDIFNRVNSGGTKLSKGDLALAKVCADWPQARDRMKEALHKWQRAGFHFSLDWLLRNVNTVVTGKAQFTHLHDVDAPRMMEGLEKAERHIDAVLNLIGGRLGLDHDRVLFGRYAFPVMTRLLEARGGRLADEVERDRLMFWYVHSAMWGRFSGSTETILDKDLRQLEGDGDGVGRLIEQVRLWRGGLGLEPGHFVGSSVGSRQYPLLYLLTRVGDARDWGTGLALKHSLLGKMSSLEVHHIFPKAHLYRNDYGRSEVNAVANFCLLTKDTNLAISDRPPVEYFPEIESKHPGALASQWIPDDPQLWQTSRYRDFLEARRELLANAANGFLNGLLHDGTEASAAATTAPEEIPGGFADRDEERLLVELNAWVVQQGLPPGDLLHELSDEASGAPAAILDLAWPSGMQPGRSRPIAVLIDETGPTYEAANAAGFRYFTGAANFKRYVEQEILGES